MKILVVNQFHRMPGRGGMARVNDLARFWTEAGAEVVVLASTVDHASGEVPPDYRGRLLTSEVADGARVHRPWSLGISKASAVGRIARDASFALSAAASGILRRERPDVVLATSPPLFTGVAGVALARTLGVPLIFEVRDLWPDFAVEFGALRGTPARAAYALEGAIYRRAAAVVAVTPVFARRIVEKGVPREKVHYIPNGADLDSFAPGLADAALRDELGWADRFVVLYAGVHGPSQALDQLVRAADLLRDAPDVLVSLIGEGDDKPRLKALAADLGLDNVQFLPQVSRERIPALLRAADVGAVMLKDVPGFRGVYPAKVFEVMACGRPTLLAAAGAVAELVAEAKAGLCVPPEAPERLAAAIRELRADPATALRMGKAGRAFVADRHDRRKLAREYLEILTKLAGLSGRPAPP